MKTSVFALVAATAVAASAQAPKYTVEKFKIGGDGGHDYITTEPGTGRVFVSRGTHVMVVDGRTGSVLGDIPNTPRVHGVAFVPKLGRGFTSNAGDSSVTVFDTRTLAEVQRIKVPVGGLDGIMYDAVDDRIILTNHSRPGTVTVIEPKEGKVLGNVVTEDNAPEGAVNNDHGLVYVNNEEKSTMQVMDLKAMKMLKSWPLAPCDGPTGIAMDLRTNRIFAGCSNRSVVVDAASGKVIASFPVGDGVDGLAWDATEFLLYVPAGRSGNVTVVRMVSPNQYKVVATIPTAPGTKTIALDPSSHNLYTVALEYGPAPAGAQPGPGGRPARGPIVGATFLRISH